MLLRPSLFRPKMNLVSFFVFVLFCALVQHFDSLYEGEIFPPSTSGVAPFYLRCYMRLALLFFLYTCTYTHSAWLAMCSGEKNFPFGKIFIRLHADTVEVVPRFEQGLFL